ncbi:regulatory protein GemA [Maridesulfovibrio sp.]|uniref:regulatory protein GemA n=1 Tax=Maridesulfovibrio sp. TaxID=2795000 RepID=UPI0029CA3C5E|nr:regulatory protein GemA [Maridesulfovibrio sp.]
MTNHKKALIQKAAIGRRQIPIDDEAYYTLLRTRYGVESSKDLSVKQLGDLLGLYSRQFGWEPKPKTKKGKAPKAKAAQAQVRLIFVLWRQLAELGEIRDGSREATVSWVQKQTVSDEQPEGCADPNWLTPKQASGLVERLKKWTERVERRLKTGS